MKEPFPHDMRAVLAAPGKGLSLKKILTASFFLFAGYIIYTLFTYLALLYDGAALVYLWQSHGFFPLMYFPFDSYIALLIYIIGIFLSLLALSLAILGCAVINFEELRGGYFFSARQAIKFAFSRILTLFWCHLSLAAFVAFVAVLGLIVGLIGRIPVLGELTIGVFYIVPIFVSLAFTVFVVFAGIVGVILFPIVLGSQKKKEAFDALLQLFSVLTREPIRFFWYTGLSALLAKAASFLMAYMFYRTIQFSQFLFVATGGEKIEKMYNEAFAILPLDARLVTFMTTLLPGIDFGFSIVRWGYGRGMTLGSVLLSVSFFLLFLVLCGYLVSVFTAGLARGYAVIRRMKDDYFIVEEKPMESPEDYVNPPFEQKEPTDREES